MREPRISAALRSEPATHAAYTRSVGLGADRGFDRALDVADVSAAGGVFEFVGGQPLVKGSAEIQRGLRCPLLVNLRLQSGEGFVGPAVRRPVGPGD